MNSDHLLLKRIYEHRASTIQYLIKTKNCDHDKAESIFADSALTIRRKTLDGSLGEIRDLRTYLIGVCNMFWKKQMAYEQKLQRSVKNVEYYFYEHFADSPFDLAVIDNIQEKLLTVLNEAFQTLGDKCKSLIKLFYYEKKSMTEIARKLGFNSQAVAITSKYRCFQSLKQKARTLRNELEQKESQ